MLKINRKIEYALIALKHMSHKSPGQLTSAKELCDIYHTPFDPMSRVLQIMSQHEILRAEQGAHGGYQILKDLSRVSVGQLSDMIIGPIQIANCFHGDYSHCTMTHSCSVIGPMLNLNEQISQLFHNLKIVDLIETRHTAEKAIRQKPFMANLDNKN